MSFSLSKLYYDSSYFLQVLTILLSLFIAEDPFITNYLSETLVF